MIVLADSDPRFQARVKDHVDRQDDLVVVDGIAQLEKSLADRADRIDVVIFGPNIGLEEAMGVARQMQATTAHVSVLLISNAVTTEILQTSMRNGVREVLPAAFTSAQLRDAIGRAKQLSHQIRGVVQHAVSAPPKTSGNRVITIFSSKGGCGKSFLASNLAVALAAQSGEEVAMVDLDLQFGDLAIMLQLFPARTIFDAAQSLDRLDADAIRGYLTPHRAKVHLLAAPLEPGLSETISADAVQKILKLLKETFKYVVVDSPPSFTDHVLAALDESDECVLMTSMDVPSIKNMKLSLQTLQLLGFGRDRIRLVLNRADSKVGLTVQAVEKTLGTTVDVSVPSSRDVSVSINRGTPLVIDNPKSPVVASIFRLLDVVAPQESESAAPQSLPQAEDDHKARFRLRKKGLGRNES
jgi:pilus assembly protein CpaE